jgi:hypothetical protein
MRVDMLGSDYIYSLGAYQRLGDDQTDFDTLVYSYMGAQKLTEAAAIAAVKRDFPQYASLTFRKVSAASALGKIGSAALDALKKYWDVKIAEAAAQGNAALARQLEAQKSADLKKAMGSNTAYLIAGGVALLAVIVMLGTRKRR